MPLYTVPIAKAEQTVADCEARGETVVSVAFATAAGDATKVLIATRAPEGRPRPWAPETRGGDAA